jgi:hypothetical protein
MPNFTRYILNLLKSEPLLSSPLKSEPLLSSVHKSLDNNQDHIKFFLEQFHLGLSDHVNTISMETLSEEERSGDERFVDLFHNQLWNVYANFFDISDWENEQDIQDLMDHIDEIMTSIEIDEFRLLAFILIKKHLIQLRAHFEFQQVSEHESSLRYDWDLSDTNTGYGQMVLALDILTQIDGELIRIIREEVTRLFDQQQTILDSENPKEEKEE